VTTLPYVHHSIGEADIAAVVSVLRSDNLTQGPAVPEFEEALAEYCGARYSVAVSSGTAALALAYEVSAKRRIVTSPLTFVATANAALMAGANAMFADVERATGNLNPLAAPVEMDGWVSAYVPVHYAGRAAQVPTLPHGDDVVIEDACQALGAMDYDGCSRVGSCAHSLATCFSFHASKPVACGEGGAITTNSEGFARELRSLRDHGREDGLMVRLGGNYRMTDIQAALGLSQLKRCDDSAYQRRTLARVYGSGPMANDSRVVLPTWRDQADLERSAHHLYPIRIKNRKRDSVKRYLNEHGIGAQVHYRPIHEQPYYASRYGYKPEDFPEAHAWGQEELSLPLFAGMTEQDVERVVTCLREALSQ
jgi:perosamine synthetase